MTIGRRRKYERGSILKRRGGGSGHCYFCLLPLRKGVCILLLVLGRTERDIAGSHRLHLLLRNWRPVGRESRRLRKVESEEHLWEEGGGEAWSRRIDGGYGGGYNRKRPTRRYQGREQTWYPVVVRRRRRPAIEGNMIMIDG